MIEDIILKIFNIHEQRNKTDGENTKKERILKTWGEGKVLKMEKIH